MFKIILYAFLFYLLYRFIVDLVIPVGKASKQVSQKMKEMQEAQQQQYRQQQEAQQREFRKTEEKKADQDYIDFEEV